MKRRDFGKVLSVGAVGTVVSQSKTAHAKPNLLMHVGADYHSVAGDSMASKENLEYCVRHGVYHLTARVEKTSEEGAWDFDEMKRLKDSCDKHGVTLESIRMSFGFSTSYIQLGKSPERDRKIEILSGNIKKASEIGVQVISQHWTIIPIRRNARTPGRGGSSVSTFVLEDDWKDLPISKAGRIPLEEYWERITYFLENIIPVAEEYKVKIACHPSDPPLPHGYMGVDRWNSPIFEGLKRYAATVESPYNGFQLCIGTVAEGLKNPKTEILPILQYLGERGKLLSIHFRNIKGGLNNFQEVYPDNGDMDFYKVMQVLRDVQYPYSIMPDHMPRHPDDPRGLQAFAFGHGYIKGLIQAVNSET